MEGRRGSLVRATVSGGRLLVRDSLRRSYICTDSRTGRRVLAPEKLVGRGEGGYRGSTLQG